MKKENKMVKILLNWSVQLSFSFNKKGIKNIAATIIKTSIMSSKMPTPKIAWPIFLFIKLNSSKIGTKIPSPTVAKEKAARIETIQEYPKTKWIIILPKKASKKIMKKVDFIINLPIFLISSKSNLKPIRKSRKYIPSQAKNLNVSELVKKEKGL